MKFLIEKPDRTGNYFQFKTHLIKIYESKNREQDQPFRILADANKKNLSSCLLVDDNDNNYEVLHSEKVIVHSISSGTDGNLSIQFVNHPTVFKLYKKDINFSLYLNLLVWSISNSQMILISFKNEVIINIRPYDGSDKLLFVHNAKPAYDISQYRNSIQKDEVGNLFDYLANESCVLDPGNIDYCITFQYVWDGCYARAHKMKEVMEKVFSLTCEKIFNFGKLSVDAYGKCIPWNWHVAPLVTVVQNDEIEEKLVLDPSLSRSPLSIYSWRDLQISPCRGNPHLNNFEITPGRNYGLVNGLYTYDDDYYLTNEWLSGHNYPT